MAVDHIIYENGANICPYCGGRTDCGLTGDEYTIGLYKEHYECECYDCGRLSTATSTEVLSYIEDEDGSRFRGHFDIVCQHCGCDDVDFMKPSWEDDCWRGGYRCPRCFQASRLDYVYDYGGTLYFGEDWKPFGKKRR